MCVAQDMVYIADPKVTKRFGEYFIRHIAKVPEKLFPSLPNHTFWLVSGTSNQHLLV